MGITIHYHGKLDDPRVLPDLLMAAKHFCFQRKWKYHEIDDRIIGTVERWTTRDVKNEELSNAEMEWTDTFVETHTAPIDDVQRGILIQPHPDCETVWLTFNQHSELCFYMPEAEPGHYWENKLLFTKTQFAPIDIHISICELLRLIRDRYFPGLQVSDEGEYFETHDPARLAENMGKLNAIMDQVGRALDSGEGPLADAIHRAVDEAESAPGKKARRKKKRLKFKRGAKISVREPEWKRGHGTSAGRN